MSAVTVGQVEAALPPVTHHLGKSSRQRLLAGIEDYLFINGGSMAAHLAAARLGVSTRTIERYKAVLRQTTGWRLP